jgi:glycosyltransferase involved in cell wall biosynthesis
MKKIVFLIDTIESPSAGTEKQLLMLISNLDLSMIKPYLCVLRGSRWLSKDFDLCESYNIDFKSFKKATSYVSLCRFVRWLKKEQIDIVQTYFADGNKVGVFAAKLAGVRHIISTRRNQGYWHNWLEVKALHYLNGWVTCFLANSEDTKKWLCSSENVDVSRVRVIYNSVELDAFGRSSSAQRIEFRSNYGFPSRSVVVGIVANLRPVKNIDLFLKAAKRVVREFPLARFVVVGDGPERKRLESYCEELILNEYVVFMGGRLDVSEILGCIDVGVLCSRSESLSNSLIEYMAASLVVVCTDVGGARELVLDGDNGYVVGVEDFDGLALRLLSVLKSESRLAMGMRGREIAEKLFAKDKIFIEYKQLYDGMR